MKTFPVIGPDNKTYPITVPENATNDEIRAEILRVYKEANPDYVPMGSPGDREPPAAPAAPPVTPPAPPQPRVTPPQEAPKVDPRSIVGGTTASMYDIVPEEFAYGKPPVRDQALQAVMAAMARNRELNPDFGGPVVDVLGGTAGALASKLFAGKTPTALEQSQTYQRAVFDALRNQGLSPEEIRQALQAGRTSPLNAVAPSQSQMPGTEVRMPRGEPTLPGFVSRQPAAPLATQGRASGPRIEGGSAVQNYLRAAAGTEHEIPYAVQQRAKSYDSKSPEGAITLRNKDLENLQKAQAVVGSGWALGPQAPGQLMLPREQAEEQIIRAQQEEEARVRAQERAQQQAAQQQANRDQQLAEERFRKATRSAQGIAPAPGTYRGALQRYPGFLGGLAGAGGTELMQQASQYQAQGDPLGAGIAGALSVGTTAGILPFAPARAVGMGTGAISPLVLYLYDKMRNRGSVMDGR